MLDSWWSQSVLLRCSCWLLLSTGALVFMRTRVLNVILQKHFWICNAFADIRNVTTILVKNSGSAAAPPLAPPPPWNDRPSLTRLNTITCYRDNTAKNKRIPMQHARKKPFYKRENQHYVAEVRTKYESKTWPLVKAVLSLSVVPKIQKNMRRNANSRHGSAKLVWVHARC